MSNRRPPLQPVPRHPRQPPADGESNRIEIAPGLYAAVILITPEIAKRWLERNSPDNRKIAEATVEGMVNDQLAGKWKLTHQAIAFDGQNVLIDGQHRLTAIVQSGIPTKMLVIWNEGSELKDPIDRVRPRSVGFIMGGLHNSFVSALGVLRGLEVGYRVRAILTVADAEETLSHHKKAIETLQSNVKAFRQIPGGTLGALAWALPVDYEQVVDFAQKFTSGAMIKPGDAVFSLRQWRERGKGSWGDSWLSAMATLNALQSHLRGIPHSKIYTGDTGYLTFNQHRRAAKIEWTPGPEGSRRP